jgi:V-type H+-transporting ATPase subunit a
MKWFIIKEKAICSELNKLQDDGEKFLSGLFWCPSKYQDILQEKMIEMRTRKNFEAPQITKIDKFDEEEHKRPTFIESNDFMWPFQEIVNTYGVPLYKEINPAIYASVTFPFLFGVMFGDIFHGLILMTFAVVLCFKTFEFGSMLL